jgi:uncharacterized membrane protein
MLSFDPIIWIVRRQTMLYICLKILHIISAALLLTSMGYSYHLWKYTQTPRDGAIRSQRIQTLTWLIIIPLALIQLATGFTMISINNEDLSQLWISGSVIGFITVIGGWFSFIYFLLLSQQIEVSRDDAAFGQWSQQGLFYRRIQSIMLSVCALSILVMIFFMANKVT